MKNNFNVRETEISGNYISVQENSVIGIYKYNASIVAPFEFKFIFIKEDGFLESKDDKNNLVSYIKE